MLFSLESIGSDRLCVQFPEGPDYLKDLPDLLVSVLWSEVTVHEKEGVIHHCYDEVKELGQLLNLKS